MRVAAHFDTSCWPPPLVPAATACRLQANCSSRLLKGCLGTGRLACASHGFAHVILRCFMVLNCCGLDPQASKSGKQLEPRFSDPLETEGSNTVIEWERVSVAAASGQHAA